MKRIKLLKFRVQNYRCIEDSGWVELEDVTALVGKNESGKTALLTALYKLNSATKTSYDPLHDFPRHRYTDERKIQDWEIVKGIYTIDSEMIESLKWEPPQNFEIPEEGLNLELSRKYSGKMVKVKPSEHENNNN